MKFSTQKKNNRGFTLVETMVAIFILAVALDAFFGLASSSLFSARYSQNELTANYMLQEAVDFIRNDRDTIAFQNNDPSINDGWDNFIAKYVAGECFANFSDTDQGCYVEPADPTSIRPCATLPSFGVSHCPVFLYDPDALNDSFYTYNSGTPVNFKRQVIMSVNPNRADEIDVKVTVEWLNGKLVRSRSLVVSLLNWQK